MIKKNKKAQAWGMDLVIGVIIFSIAVIVLYFYAINYTDESEDLDALVYDGDIIADSILSEGYPINWNSGNVIKIGVLSDGKVNETKLEQFYDLSYNDYGKTKELFNTKFDYFFLFDENMTFGSEEVRGIGKPGTVLGEVITENLIKVTRFNVYKERPITAYLYIWED